MVVAGEVRSGWMLNGNISPAFLPVRLLVEQPPRLLRIGCHRRVLGKPGPLRQP